MGEHGEINFFARGQGTRFEADAFLCKGIMAEARNVRRITVDVIGGDDQDRRAVFDVAPEGWRVESPRVVLESGRRQVELRPTDHARIAWKIRAANPSAPEDPTVFAYLSLMRSHESMSTEDVLCNLVGALSQQLKQATDLAVKAAMAQVAMPVKVDGRIFVPHGWGEHRGADAAGAARLVADLVDSDPCSYDHHGLCQAHSLGERPCAHERAKEFLRREQAKELQGFMGTSGD